jgi:purine-binding chemotaxis protein CheW
MNPGGDTEVLDYIDTLLGDAAAPAPSAAAAPDVAAASADAWDAVAGPAVGPAIEPVPAPVPVPASAPTPASAPAPAPANVAAPMSAPTPVPPTPAPAPRATARVEPPAASAPMATASRWLRVLVGQASYALELLRVQEVVRMVPIVPMRGAQASVLGVMNLRGRIVPVFDLGLWLRTGDVQVTEQARIVVVERDDELIGVLVSAVEDVVTLGRDRIEPPLPGNVPGVILGVARVGATPTVLFDAYALYG